MAQNWGKRSIGVDVKTTEGRDLILQLIAAADVVVENQLRRILVQRRHRFRGFTRQRPELIVCSITGFGHTGSWSQLPAHGLNIDALGDGLTVDWKDGQPHRGAAYTSWANELGTLSAAMAVCAALVSVRSGGPGEWIDVSCWDALVESHRTELAMNAKTKEPFRLRNPRSQALYTTYLASDDRPVLLGALEPKFWRRFCEGIGRADLIDCHDGAEISFGDDDSVLRRNWKPSSPRPPPMSGCNDSSTGTSPADLCMTYRRSCRQQHFADRKIIEGEPGHVAGRRDGRPMAAQRQSRRQWAGLSA